MGNFLFYAVDSLSAFSNDIRYFRSYFDDAFGVDHSIPAILVILSIPLACWLVRIIVGVIRR